MARVATPARIDSGPVGGLSRARLRLLAALGTVLAVINVYFYLAIDRLPLSTVGSIEFLGPGTLAALGVRSARTTVALLPAAAALLGLAVLHQVPGWRDGVGIGLVIGGVALHRAAAVP
ncbi:MAG: hypothetical protein ACRDNS_06950 [Trebonia sp.]